MAFVMGISRAHANLLKVQDDFIDNSGVYAILNSPPFISFANRFSRETGGGGKGAIIIGTNNTSPSCIGCHW